MRYTYQCELRSTDVWLLTLSRIYRSTAGVCNLVFTVAMLGLTYRFFNQAQDFLQFFMIVGCLIFPVIHPFLIYMKAKAQVATLPNGLLLSFGDEGICVKTPQESQQIDWKSIKKVMNEPNMIIVMSDAMHGYMLTNRMLGAEKKEFYEYVTSKISHTKKKR